MSSNTYGRQVIVPLTNKSGGGVIAGDVVVIDTTNNDAFTTSTAGAFLGLVGIAQETIASNAVGRVLTAGYAALVLTSASVTRGNFGKTHTVAKQAVDAGATRGVGTFCQFLTGGTTPDAVLFGLADASSGAGGLTTGAPANTWGVAAAAGVAATGVATDARIVGDYALCQGRLTLTTAVPVTTADVTAATTLYFTPFRGSLIGTYNGTDWNVATFTEKSITLATLTAGLPYDVFTVNGTLALELLAWTNTTTRATAIALQDGVYCKSGALTRRYLGTIQILATGQTEDSLLNRLVWNYYNRVERNISAIDTTDSWTSVATGWRSYNGSTANRIAAVVGVSEEPVELHFAAAGRQSGGNNFNVGVGLDSTSANSAIIIPTQATTIWGIAVAHYRGYLGIGSHYLQLLEYDAGATTTFWGDIGVAYAQSGAQGYLKA